MLAHLAFARVGLAEIQIALGDRSAARDSLARAASETARLLSTDSTRNKWSIALTGSLLVHSLAAAGPQAPKQRDLEVFLSTVKNAESGGKALDTEQTCIVSAVELALGDLLASDAQPAAARGHWQTSTGRLQAAASGGDLPAMTLRAQAVLRLGATEEARSLAQRIEASPYRHPAYADLRQRLAAAAGARPVTP
jgi:hypothetical protein